MTKEVHVYTTDTEHPINVDYEKKVRRVKISRKQKERKDRRIVSIRVYKTSRILRI